MRDNKIQETDNKYTLKQVYIHNHILGLRIETLK